ncbi:uncharacterized protein LOC112340955 [Selaginella moellendorffii]|uniref:uncharacterized protein LOC112340955 n=1 Tax=Selaginella moellendorffii TaxID=88036 RepID=UPI000D1C8D95|nr:uncharacterized protein LOC112340955 [Selaginella moellendorffii]|eukprot:XP_024516010.1 uncharacterized protein LOC112340955 [Selaginella moellendorffii]
MSISVDPANFSVCTFLLLQYLSEIHPHPYPQSSPRSNANESPRFPSELHEMVCSKLLPVEVAPSLAHSSGDRFKQPLRVQCRNLSTKLNSKVEDPLVAKSKQGSLDYHVNVGYAIRTLREELPVLFHRDLSYQIYREDISFRDPVNCFHGLGNYKFIVQVLRLNGRMLFKSIWVEILSVWQPSESTIVIRWSVRGIPRVPWEARGLFDGVSEYKLDSKGKIYEHKVHNVIFNSPPKCKVATTVSDLVAATTHMNY